MTSSDFHLPAIFFTVDIKYLCDFFSRVMETSALRLTAIVKSTVRVKK